jgi:hypothetical protein
MSLQDCTDSVATRFAGTAIVVVEFVAEIGEGRKDARKVVGLSKRKQPPLNGPSAAPTAVEAKAISIE